MLVLRFHRITLEDLCSANSIWCGFRLALPFCVEYCDRSDYPEIDSRASEIQRWIKNEVTGPSVGFKTLTSNRTNPDDSFVCLNSSTAAAAHTRVFVISLTECLTYSFKATSAHILLWCPLCMMPWVLQHYLMQ